MIGTVALPPHYTLGDLEQLNNHSGYYQLETGFSSIRQKALRDAAQALGTQAGLHYESLQINALLQSHSEELDQIFDFNQVMYQQNVLPPVITRANNLVHINPEGTTIRIAGVTYQILSPARFVTAPPTWRDYIWLSYPKPNLPDKSLLPENDKEQAFWQQNVALAWQQGINQALSIFSINLNTMVRNFDGMLLYKKLLLQNMVSPYYVNQTEKGITGTGTHMVIDDQTLHIANQPQLLYQSQRWQAAPAQVATPAQAVMMGPDSSGAASAIPANSSPNLEQALDAAIQDPSNGDTHGQSAVSK